MNSRLTSSKLLLIADSRSAAASSSLAVPIRRYRIARLRLESKQTPGASALGRKRG